MFGLILISSCKKDKIKIPESNEPVFRITGMLDGDSIGLVAGDENAYMHTMTLVENGVNVYTGVISNGDLSFEVGVFDGSLDVINTGTPSANIAPIFSSFSVVPLTVLSKNTFQNASNINYIHWYVDGVDRGINDVSIYEPGKYEVCATLYFGDGTNKMLCNDLILGFSHNATAYINTALLGNGYVHMSIGNTTNPIESVEWYLNDVLTETSLDYELSLGTSLDKITAKIRFQNGVVRTKSVLANGYSALKNVEDFTMFEVQSEGAIPRDFNLRFKVTKGADVYRSDLTNNISAKVYISEIEYFGLNSAGKNVYKITGSVSCKQRKEGTSTDVNLDANIVFGIEVP